MNEHPRPMSLRIDNGRAAPAYRYRHLVSFQDTNVVGNVYFACHIAWQGRCRELFLREHAPQVVADIARGLRLVTLNVGCEYYDELLVTDEIEIEMTLTEMRQNRIGLAFSYFAQRPDRVVLAARGHQGIACMTLGASGLVPTPLPAALVRALEPFRSLARAPAET